jgi:hypothetical protein
MDQKQLFKQMIDFQKGTFDNSFNAMVQLQEQGENMLNQFISQAAWLPEDGRKVIKEWIDAYKTARKEFKSIVDGNFGKVQEFFENPEQTD